MPGTYDSPARGGAGRVARGILAMTC